jgi:hypothetical protein
MTGWGSPLSEQPADEGDGGALLASHLWQAGLLLAACRQVVVETGVAVGVGALVQMLLVTVQERKLAAMVSLWDKRAGGGVAHVHGLPRRPRWVTDREPASPHELSQRHAPYQAAAGLQARPPAPHRHHFVLRLFPGMGNTLESG